MTLPNININIKLVRPGAKLPHRATPTSGAFDCYAPEAGFLEPGQRQKVPLGFAHDIPVALSMQGLYLTPWGINPVPACVMQLQGLLIPRSGLADKHGIRFFFAPCLIDHDFRGEISVPLVNDSSHTYHWQQHERLCQIAYVPMFMGSLQETTELTTTHRGAGGFGSTGY